MATALTLRRAAASRPDGQWPAEDYDVVYEGCAVGRVYRGIGNVAAERPWFWGLMTVPSEMHDRGHAESRDAAMAALRRRWDARVAEGPFHVAGRAAPIGGDDEGR